MTFRAIAVLLVLASTAVADDALTVKGEVIVIEGKGPKATPPKAQKYNPLKVPPYTDHAVLSDAWTVAWMVLDVDEKGSVTRVKFLKKPGYELEDIAIAEAFKQTFSPALDGHSKPMRSKVIWKIEWPSAWWLNMVAGMRTAIPEVGWPPHRADLHVPCRGSGPLHLGSAHPVYKDCSKPDLSKADTQPWIDPPPKN